MRRHLFVIACSGCPRTWIVARPRRRLRWLPTPPGHGRSSNCPGRFKILHRKERLEALRARGLA